MKLKVTQVGNPKFPRYAIIAECGVYFRTQNEWTPDPKRAALYASLAAAKDEWKQLQAEMQSGLLFLTATVVVKIKGVKELTTEQVKQLAVYLSTASTFTLDYKKVRPNWLRTAVVSCLIQWNLRPGGSDAVAGNG